MGIEPPFRDEIFTYSAKLDFAMDYFAIDARPKSGCEIDHAPPHKTFVQIGGSVTVTLFSKNPETGAKRAYTVTATRLLGSETELQFLMVVGGELSPIFSPTSRTYHVTLALDYDVAKVVYRLRDNEQRIRSTAHMEEPVAGSTKIDKPRSKTSDSQAKSTSESEHRRLLEMNSNRYPVVVDNVSDAYTRWSTGVQRRLGATVKEPLHIRRGTIPRCLPKLHARCWVSAKDCGSGAMCRCHTSKHWGLYIGCAPSRCSPERPYFDPQKRVCVNFCPSGFYRNEEIHRCSKCNTNCKVCDSLLHCQMCVPDTADYTYMVQPDGRCQATVNHLFRKYRWWCVGLAVLLGFLVLIGCIGICQLFGTFGHGIEKRAHKVHTYDSDSGGEDGPPYGARRRLAQY